MAIDRCSNIKFWSWEPLSMLPIFIVVERSGRRRRTQRTKHAWLRNPNLCCCPYHQPSSVGRNPDLSFSEEYQSHHMQITHGRSLQHHPLDVGLRCLPRIPAQEYRSPLSIDRPIGPVVDTWLCQSPTAASSYCPVNRMVE